MSDLRESSDWSDSPLLGAPKPRVDLWPGTAVSSDGEIAFELAKLAGVHGLPWQYDSMELMLGVQANGRWACREYVEWVPRQNGKSFLATIRMLYGFLILGEKLIIYSAHEFRTCQEIFLKMRGMFEALGERFERRGSEHFRIDDKVVKVNAGNGDESFELYDARGRSISRIKFISRSKSAGRGFTVDGCLIIDETFAYTHAQQDAIRPTLRTKPHTQIIYLSSPPLSGISGEVMYQLRKRSESTNPGRFGYRDWGIEEDLDEILDREDLDEFLSDPQRWAESNPSLGHLIEPEDVAEDIKSMSAEGVARELLGAWPKQLSANGGVIQPHEWVDLKDEASTIVGPIHIGLDSAPFGRWTTIAVAGQREDGRLHVEIIRHARGMADTPAAVKKLVDKWGADLGPVCVDPHSPAGAMIPALKALGIELREIGSTDLAQATGLFVDSAMSDGLRHLGQRELTDAVLGGRLRAQGDANVWARRDASVIISPAVASCVALAGVVADRPAEPGDVWAYYDEDDDDYYDDEDTEGVGW